MTTPGVAMGLAWTPTGGDLLFIEATAMKGKKGLTLTGQLGDVMKESATAALSLSAPTPKRLGVDEDFFDKHDIHIHVPAGAIPKDGPSAGVTMLTALVSLLTETNHPQDLAMTGEITLRGQVLPVGGIKEKVLAAHRAGIKTILLPKWNEKDLVDIPQKVRDDIEFHFHGEDDRRVEDCHFGITGNRLHGDLPKIEIRRCAQPLLSLSAYENKIVKSDGCR
jgi:ATP-dependent Lon protease